MSTLRIMGLAVIASLTLSGCFLLSSGGGETSGIDSAEPGQILAGTTTPLKAFDQAQFDTAVAEGKLVMLYFYANWCPTCKAELSGATFPAFDQLDNQDTVAFLLHFADNQVTDEMEALAREHGVAFQHTKVFILNGERILKTPATWDTTMYLSTIANFSKDI